MVPALHRGRIEAMRREMPQLLLIENCDFKSYPVGGQLTFARHLLQAFGNRFALVGVTTGAEPVGRWVEQEIGGQRYHFFAVGRPSVSAERPWIPCRLSFYFQLLRFRHRITCFGARFAFLMAPETLLAVRNWGWDGLCYNFSGTENPVVASRYWWARPLAGPFDRLHLNSVGNAELVLAAADEDAIDGVVSRSRGKLSREQIVQFPTTVDLNCFHPLPQAEVRRRLPWHPPGPVIVAPGRLSRVKGWDFLLEAFAIFRRNIPTAELIFVGDGEDRRLLTKRIAELSLDGFVHIEGFQPPRQVNLYLNAADLVVLCSSREGWSTSLLEALACGKPLVSTPFSSACHLIVQGANGFVVAERNPRAFAAAMESALALPDAASVSLEIARRYSLGNFAERLRTLWTPLRSA